ncbi:predicted protein [Uncinocarpus reesii 1704]|uniref:Uncharacterized protein n=1 Tax=Uncinocarpus reesii (strain UAMH 1704) TaxID=336963 RepID=C4JMT1_UNCRE|nr:uncharacterized protein UREG_04139 [Uncinocarpus reesii 1704]EEP79293.1 predicted protein [Uncinocarpus reesii 1704]
MEPQRSINLAENGVRHSSQAKDPRLRFREIPSQPSQDPAQFFHNYATDLADFVEQTGKRERLVRSMKRKDALLSRATDRQFPYPSYLSRGRAVQAEQVEQLSKIDQQLDLHKKKQAEFSEMFHRMMAKDDSYQQLKRDVELSKANANVALHQAGKLGEKLNNVDIDSLVASMDIAVKELKRLESVKQRFNDIEQKFSHVSPDDILAMKKELPQLKKMRSQLQSLHDKNSYTGAQSWKQLSADLAALKSQVNSLKDEVALTSTTGLQSAQSSVNSLSKRLEEIEESSTAQYQLLESRVAEVESRKGPKLSSIQSDMESLFSQLEKLRELQEQRDKEIDMEFQKLSLKLNKTIERLNDEHATAKKHTGEQSNRQDMIFAAHETRLAAIEGRNNAEVVSDNEKIMDILKYQSERLHGHDVAITSLENRYNRLSSEPIVRQMVASMQGMYPYASTAQKEIEQLKQDFKSHKDAVATISSDITKPFIRYPKNP